MHSQKELALQMSPFESSEEIYLVNASEESVFCVFLSCTSFVHLHNFFNLKLTSLFIGSTHTLLTTYQVIHGEFPLRFQ